MDSLFTTHATSTARASRYTPTGDASETVETLTDGSVIRGKVFAGTDRNGRVFLVHNVSGAETAIPLHAVATAVAAGKVISADAVAGVFAETGKLPKLAAAVAKLTPKPTA